MGQKSGALPPFWGGGAGSHLAQCGLDRGLHLHAKWHFNPSSRLATINVGQKFGDVPLWGRGSWVPIYDLTQCGQGRGLYLHAKFHLDPSNRLATVHQRYRQTGQDRQERTVS